MSPAALWGAPTERTRPEQQMPRGMPSLRMSNIYRLVTAVVLLLSMCSVASAYEMRAQDVSNTTFYKNIIAQGQIIFDSRPQPSMGHRQQEKRVVSSTSEAPTSTESMSATVTSVTSSESLDITATITRTVTPTANSTSSSVDSATLMPTPTALPTPFDTSLGNNFTNTACPAYFNEFLNNATFLSCLPVSMLLQNSNSFFKTVRIPKLLDATLDKACSASLALCSPLMASLANGLISDSVCADDYDRQNPLVVQAHSALIAYEPMFKATCLKDQKTGEYCFAEAMGNSSSAADSYPYYTAVGLPLPSDAQPDCTWCLQQTMQVFAGYAVRKEQPLAQTYLNCAIQVNQGCGANFANVAVKAGSVEDSVSAAGRSASSSTFALVLVVALSMVWQIAL